MVNYYLKYQICSFEDKFPNSDIANYSSNSDSSPTKFHQIKKTSNNGNSINTAINENDKCNSECSKNDVYNRLYNDQLDKQNLM